MKPYEKGHLKVSDIHQIYYEQTGNPMGESVLYVHGGPGAGLPEDYHKYFNLRKWRLIACDQRGSGKSTPLGCIKDNNLNTLVEDLEKLRLKLRVKKWAIFGGSWGSTLALAYANKYPQNIHALILKSIFLGRKVDVDWLYNEGGISRIQHDIFEFYIDNRDKKHLLDQYYADLQLDNEQIRKHAAKKWITWELNLSMITHCRIKHDWQEIKLDDQLEAFALIEAHFFANYCFLPHKKGILSQLNHLEGIPIYIFHGRWDWVCPYDEAKLLHSYLPQSKLSIIPEEGHFLHRKESKKQLKSCLEKVHKNIMKSYKHEL